MTLPAVIEPATTNVIACARQAEASSLIAILGLDPAQWCAMAIGEPLFGERFDRAVVFQVEDRVSSKFLIDWEWVKRLSDKSMRVRVM